MQVVLESLLTATQATSHHNNLVTEVSKSTYERLDMNRRAAFPG